MSVKGPDGLFLDPQINGPDGNSIPERLWPFTWSQPSREKGAMRRPLGGLDYETAWAVVDTDGNRIGSVLVPSNEEIAFWVRAMYAGMVAKGTAEDVTDGRLFEGL